MFFGGFFVGCSFGFMNVLKIKGIYIVMKFGMLVVECVFEVIIDENFFFVIEGKWFMGCF